MHAENTCVLYQPRAVATGVLTIHQEHIIIVLLYRRGTRKHNMYLLIKHKIRNYDDFHTTRSQNLWFETDEESLVCA